MYFLHYAMIWADKLKVLFTDHHFHLSDRLHDDEFLTRLAELGDVFSRLNNQSRITGTLRNYIQCAGGWITLAKEKYSLNVWTKFERNTICVCMEHFWDLLFQLMKHGTNTLHVAFIFLFSIVAISHTQNNE